MNTLSQTPSSTPTTPARASAGTLAGASAGSLAGNRILVVQVRPQSSLGIGAAVVRAGAEVNVCRSPHAAISVLQSPRAGFDAAALDGELPRDALMEVARTLRASAKPCLVVGVGTPKDPAAVRRLVEAGVMELVIPPLNAASVVSALGRCVLATRNIRARLGEQGGRARTEERRPCHWSPSNGVVPRHNPDIENAVARYADSACLSPREVTVLKFIALGYRYEEIGETLAISGRTVKMHAANVRRKVGAPNRLALVRKVLSA